MAQDIKEERGEETEDTGHKRTGQKRRGRREKRRGGGRSSSTTRCVVRLARPALRSLSPSACWRSSWSLARRSSKRSCSQLCSACSDCVRASLASASSARRDSISLGGGGCVVL
jgi:hypothetical protein